MSKFLLCRPIGGLNDTLNQIELCWRYAEAFHRYLLIDTRKSGFGVHLSTYFRTIGTGSSIDVDTAPDEEILRRVKLLECSPPEMSGRLVTYTSVADHDRRVFVDTDSRTPLTFNFRHDHSAQVLLHEQAGSGNLSLDALARLRLHDRVRSEIRSRIGDFPPDRIAVHVRNTDIKTNYDPLFARLAAKYPTDPILVCTDDTSVLRRAKDVFGDARVITSSIPPDLSGRPLHHELTLAPENRDTLNIDMFTDLFALATSRHLFFTATKTGKISGFSQLAWHLHNNASFCHAVLSDSDKEAANQFERVSELRRTLPSSVRLARYRNKLKSLVSSPRTSR